ncbi:MAG TPA: B12-binding domain-containing radical SAM protein [Sneathiellales bacterium]|nr:B12-binding domain-containing radical SAM protein [Sneathiellales bacterium]
MKETVLLISNPTALSGGQFPKLNLPLGIAYLAGELIATGLYDVECFDYQDPAIDDDYVISQIKQNNYLLVGIKGYAVDYAWARDLVYLIRERVGDDVRIVLGGPLATFSYEVLLKNLPVNYCIAGEAETSLPALLENLDSPGNIPGVAYVAGNGKVVYGEGEGGWTTSKHIDDIARPAYEIFDIPQYTVNRAPVPRNEVFDMKKYVTLDFLTGRGCPFSCTFCGRLTRKYRKRSVEGVVEEMKFLISTYGINCFAIEDELFMQARSWIEEFCEKVMPLKVVWRCQSRAKGLKPEVLKLMRRAGCVRVTLGVESGSGKILETMHKQIMPDDIRQTVIRCREAGIYPGTELIIGTPGENEATVCETVELFRELKLPAREMAFLQLLPGTPLFMQHVGADGPIGDHLSVLEGLSNDDGTLTNLIHNVSGLSDAELTRLKSSAEAEMKKNFENYYRTEKKLHYYFNKVAGFTGLFNGTNQTFYHKREKNVNTPIPVPGNILEGQDHR